MFKSLISFLTCQMVTLMKCLSDIKEKLDLIIVGLGVLGADTHPEHGSLVPTHQSKCVKIDGGAPQEISLYLVWNQHESKVVGKIWLDSAGNPVEGAIVDVEDCECFSDIGCSCNDSEDNAFDLSDVNKAENTKVAFDTPTFDKAHTDVGTNNWTAADLVAALNAAAANATAANNNNGIDYTGTTWAVHSTNPEAIVASGVNIPATLDLVSIGVSLPVTSI